jgi:hypothetical protein
MFKIVGEGGVIQIASWSSTNAVGRAGARSVMTSAGTRYAITDAAKNERADVKTL